MIEDLAPTPEVIVPKNQVDIVADPYGVEWQEGAAIEANVFIEKGYVNSQEELSEEYAKYLSASEFVVVKRFGSPSGSTRLIHYSEAGFKTLSDIEEGRLSVDEQGREILSNLDLTKTFEVGTLAADKEARANPEDEGRVAVALYAAIYAEGKHHEAPNVLASFDADYFDRFKDIFGPGVQALGPATDYMGSPTVPALLNVDVLLDHLGQVFPEMQQTIIKIAEATTHQ